MSEADAAATPAGPDEPPTEPTLLRWQAVWRQLPLLVFLVVLWVFLWDHVDLLTISTGIVLAVLVTRFLYLPPVLLSGRFNPWRAVLLGGRMIGEISIASIQVAARAIWPAWQPLNAIVAVQLLTRSDLITTLTAEAITVIPGTVVVDIDRERGLLYLHTLGTRTQADLDKAREHVLGVEERIVLAIGTREQAATIRAARRERRAGGGRRITSPAVREVTPQETAARHPLDEPGDPDAPKGGDA
jgi:multicomponent Na+:H+ antiporter subunit E